MNRFFNIAEFIILTAAAILCAAFLSGSFAVPISGALGAAYILLTFFSRPISEFAKGLGNKMPTRVYSIACILGRGMLLIAAIFAIVSCSVLPFIPIFILIVGKVQSLAGLWLYSLCAIQLGYDIAVNTSGKVSRKVLIVVNLCVAFLSAIGFTTLSRKRVWIGYFSLKKISELPIFPAITAVVLFVQAGVVIFLFWKAILNRKSRE